MAQLQHNEPGLTQVLMLGRAHTNDGFAELVKSLKNKHRTPTDDSDTDESGFSQRGLTCDSIDLRGKRRQERTKSP